MSYARFVSILFVALLSACDGDESSAYGDQGVAPGGYGAQQASADGSQGTGETDISRLSCGQLDFMAKKYTSIGDDAARRAQHGSSPAAQMSSLTAMQAYAQSSRYYDEMARRCY